MIFVIIALLLMMIFYLLLIVIHKCKQERKIIYTLEDFSNNNLNVIVNETLDSQVTMLLKNIRENQEYVIESAFYEKNNLQGIISDLSHQLKNPLTNVKMYHTLLDEDDLTVEEIQLFKEKLRIQLSKIEWVIHSLINCMRLEEGSIHFEFEPLPISRTIKDAVDSIRINADVKNISIKTDCIVQQISILHNYNWTREVFINVLENAIKYSCENTEITISINKTELYTIICITDEGIGIKENELNLIFQRFYRSTDVKNAEGSGIGLYLSRLILEKENGYITVESIYGKGSTFKIWLQNVLNV